MFLKGGIESNPRIPNPSIKRFCPVGFDGLVKPWPELQLPIVMPEERLKGIFTGANYAENYRILVKNVRERGAAVPPLVNAYMNLSGTMRSFGTAVNPTFGNVEETGILIRLSDIAPEKYERYTQFNPDEKPMHLS